MALSILDGNQSATTLSTILSSGQHITAHTVISLGTQAITDITSAVSGTSVCVGSISISGTPSVTGSVSVLNFPASQSTTFGAVTGSVSVLNFPVSQSVTFGATTGSVSVLNFPSSQAVTFSAISISNFPATQPVSLTTLPALVAGTAQIGSVTASIIGTVPISISSVTVGNTVTIAGTVTANPTGTQTIAGTVTANVIDPNNTLEAVVMNSLTSVISNFVANVGDSAVPKAVQIGFYDSVIEGILLVNNTDQKLPISGTVTVGNSVTIGSLPAISGTVTANSSNGSLTTRFGSVTTANTAFATSAVTNANRKYLLIQNVTTASNVITVGIGFTPTTTQGIQLSSGAGLTFEGSYIPTGAVNLLSSVTASCFTILEA